MTLPLVVVPTLVAVSLSTLGSGVEVDMKDSLPYVGTAAAAAAQKT
jgi:hypothetical protein